MTPAERLAEINGELRTLDPSRDSPRMQSILSEAATLVNRAAEPKKWGAYRVMYAQAAASTNPIAAVAAYRDAIPVWDPEKDRGPLVTCHYELGSLLFSMVIRPDDAEAAIPHLEFAAADFPMECASMLSVLFSLRVQGDPWENWQKRVHWLDVAIEHLSPQEDLAAWAQRREDRALAITAEPGGDYASGIEKRIESHTFTLAHLTPEGDAPVRAVYVRAAMNLSEAYEFRIAGELTQNQTAAVQYARLAAGAAHDLRPDLQAQAQLALGRALLNQTAGDSRAQLHEALRQFERAGALFDWQALPVLASTVERFLVMVYGKLAALGETEYLAPMASTAESAYQHLSAGGDPGGGRRTVMLIAAEALMNANRFDQGIPFLEKSAAAAEEQIAEATTRAGRLERIWDLHDAWALLAYCRLETGAIPQAAEALDRGKARLWQTAYSPVTAEQIRTLIPPGGALLFPVFAGARGAVVIAAEAGWDVAWLENLGRAQLHSLMFGDGTPPTPENLSKLNGWVYLYATRHVNAQRWVDLVGSIGDTLYRDLWRPVEEKLKQLGVTRCAELVWFPQGASSLLPVHSIRYPAADGLRVLIQDYSLRYAPSAALLLSLNAEVRTGPALLVANPLGDLPNSELEIEWAKEARNSDQTIALTREQATRPAVVATLSAASDFHFSGHATFRVDDPFQSFLALASGENLTLTDWEEALRRNPPGIVVLSACQTAMAQVTTRADEALGFPSMLLAHGVRTVIATLWPVDDIASALLMGRFYELRRPGKLTIAAALAAAQDWLRTATAAEICDVLRPLKDLPGQVGDLAAEARIRFFGMDLDSRPFEHPAFWAAFLVSGS